MHKAYLTIDDSPSTHTERLVDFLYERGIPALLFVRGDLMKDHPAPIVHAIECGMVIGNHGYAHTPAGDLSFEEWRADFEKTENLIDLAYAQAGTSRPGRHYRFPYIDRGDGVRVERIFAQGEVCAFGNHPRVSRIQDYLKGKGVCQPFSNMPKGYPVEAQDSLFTYTSGDWMLNTRHRGAWDIKNVDGLKTKIDTDAGLKNENAHHVLLLHDQEGIFEEFCMLIEYFCEKGFTFLDF